MANPLRPSTIRLLLLLISGGLLLSGCAERPTTRSSSTTTNTTRVTPATAKSTSPAAAKTTRKPSYNGHVTATDVPLPERTGIASCDDYLSSYLACHRAAAVYAPDQLQYRYDAMRSSLLRDSQNPDIRPQLAARCNSLATQLRQALHGKSCQSAPAPAATTP